MTRSVKLFIVTDSPYIGDLPNNTLCLIMRRKGPLVGINESVVKHGFLDILEAPVNKIIHGSMSSAFITARIHAGCIFGKNVEHHLDSSSADIKEFGVEHSITGCDTTILGILIPDFIETARVEPLYGCIDTMTRTEIDSELDFQKSKKQSVPKSLTFKQAIGLINDRSKVSNSADRTQDICEEDLKYADIILVHYQKIADKQHKEHMAKLGKIQYASA